MNRVTRLIVPPLQLVVTTVFLTLVAVGKEDHLVTGFALMIFGLTAVNLLSERRERKERRVG